MAGFYVYETYLALSYEDIENTLTRPIKRTDIVVHNGVSSLWENGYRVVSVLDIARAAYGEGRFTPEQQKSVEASIDLQGLIRAKVDFTQELRGRTWRTPEGATVRSGELEGALIAADKITLTLDNGKEVVGYRLLRPPLLLTQSKAVGQIASFPHRLLSIGGGRRTERNSVLIQEILKRVATLKNGQSVPEGYERLKYETLYDIAEINRDNRTETRRVRQFVEGYLDALLEEKQIKGYELIKAPNGRSTIAVDLIV